MAIIRLLVGGADFTLTIADSLSDVGALEPLNFIHLVIAAFIEYFIFTETPDA